MLVDPIFLFGESLEVILIFCYPGTRKKDVFSGKIPKRKGSLKTHPRIESPGEYP